MDVPCASQLASFFPLVAYFGTAVISSNACIRFTKRVVSLFRLFELLKGDPIPFALMYTLGNIVAVCSTCFLYGPWTQAKKMAAPTRIIATSVYASMMALTLFLVFYQGELPIRLLFVVMAIALQFIALVWYTLSFIPFARELISQLCCKCNEGYEWL